MALPVTFVAGNVLTAQQLNDSFLYVEPGLKTLKEKTTFTNVASFSLPNSTFTTTYECYRINIIFTASAADSIITLRMRASGTDNSTANYTFAYNEARSNGFGSQTGSAAQTSAKVADLDSAVQTNSLVLEIRTPADAIPTTGNYWNAASNFGDRTIWATQFGGFLHNVASAFDSLTIIGSANITGYYSVYAYRQ
jgi:hypothetical protein